jgi:hypothetical protein
MRSTESGLSLLISPTVSLILIALTPYSTPCTTPLPYEQLTTTMPDYLTFVRDGLGSVGLPIDYISSITRNLASNDIVAVATRLALVGVLAAVLKSFISKWQRRLVEGTPHIVILQGIH